MNDKNEKLQKIVEEFFDWGDLRNSIRLIHYGSILSGIMNTTGCTIEEILLCIKSAAKLQIDNDRLGNNFIE